MGNARYIGRVGALAVALGVGAAVATTPGVAWAEDGSPSPDTSAAEPADSPSPAAADVATDPGPQDPTPNNDPPADPSPGEGGGAVGANPPENTSPTQNTVEVGDGVTISSSGGAIQTDEEEDEEDGQEEVEESETLHGNNANSSRSTLTQSPKPTVRKSLLDAVDALRRPVLETDDPAAGTTQMRTMATTQQGTTAIASLFSTAADSVAPQTFSTEVPSQVPEFSPVSVVTGLLASVLGPLLSTSPTGVPVEPPMMWVLLAAARRQVGALAAARQTAVPPMVAAAAPPFGIAPPVVNPPVVGAPNSETGVVTGTVTAVGSNGLKVYYSVTGQPSGGTVSINQNTGAFTYTPSAGARLTAGFTPAADTDSFTVRATDGLTVSTVTVPVTVSPTYLSPGSAAPVTVGNAPSGMAVSADGTRAYVTNQGSNTVSVINTATRQVTTIQVGGSPTAVAVNKAGTRAYVTNSADGTVSVINTATSTVIKTVKVGTNPSAVAVSPDGSRVYVTNAADGTVSTIVTATNTALLTTKVGTNPSAVVFSADGKFAYVTNTGSDSVSMITVSTNGVKNIAVGDAPVAAAVTPDGDKVYVAHADGSVKVLAGTAKNVVATIASTGTEPTSVAVTPDGRMVLVVNRNDTITAINVATNTVLSIVSTDASPEAGAQQIVVSADGKTVYVLDSADRALRILTPTSNAAPVAVNDAFTVAEGGTATVNVLTNDTDANGNLNPGSVVVTQPTHGTVTVNNGVVTYVSNGAEVTSDSFTYTVKDALGATSNTATVNVTITPTNDPTVVTGDSFTVAEDSGTTTLNVLANDSDPDGPLTITGVTQPGNGTVAIVNGGTALSYTPNPNANGTSTFTYTVTQGGVQTTGTVTVNVTATPDTTVVTNDSVTVAEDSGTTTIDVLANDNDPDGPLTITGITQPANGTVAITSGGTKLTYTPNANFNGTNTFTYTVTQGGVTSTATVTVTVTAVNDATVVTNDNVTVTEDSGTTTIDVLANDNDPDGPLTITGITQPANGTVAITNGGTKLTYTPNANFNGTNTFTYTVTQGGVTSTATVVVTVTAVNDAPFALTGPTVNQPSGVMGTVSGSLNVTDIDNGDQLHYEVTSQPGQGKVTINPNGTFTYTPDGQARLANYIAGQTTTTDTFVVKVTDGHGGEVSVTVGGVAVTPAPAAVIAQAEQPGRAWGSPVAGPDGRYYTTTYSYDSNYNYTTKIIAIDPDDPTNPEILASVTGSPTNTMTLGPDGMLYQGISTSSGSKLIAINTADPTQPIKEAAAPYGAYLGTLEIAPDGTLYQQISGNRMMVIDPDDFSNPAVVNLPGQIPFSSYRKSISYSSNGRAYVLTESGTTDFITVIDPEHPSQSVNITLPGSISTDTYFGPDGTAYQLTYTQTCQNNVCTSQPMITAIDRNDATKYGSAPNVYSMFPTFGPDGTAYIVGPETCEATCSYPMTIFNPDDVQHPVTLTVPARLSHEVKFGPDGTRYETIRTYGCTTCTGDKFDLMVIDPDDPTNFIVVPLDSFVQEVVIDEDGAAFLTKSGPTAGTTRVVVFDPDDPYHPVNVDLPGNASSNTMITKSGTAYQPIGNKVWRITAADPANPTSTTITGTSSGAPVIGKDGKLYQTSSTGNGNSTVTYVTVIDPDDFAANPLSVNVGTGQPGGSVRVGPDGTLYQSIFIIGPDVPGSHYTNYTSRLVIIDPADPTHPTTVNTGTGNPAGLDFGPDGTVYHRSLTAGSATVGNVITTEYTTHITIIDPDDPTHPTNVQFPGTPTAVVFGTDGKAYYTTFNSVYTQGVGSIPTSYVTVVDPQNPAQVITHTVGTGYAYEGGVKFAPNGVAYQVVRYPATANSAAVSHVLVFDRNNPAQAKTVELPTEYPNVEVGPDGTVYAASIFYDQQTYTYTKTIRVISLDDADPPAEVTIEFEYYDQWSTNQKLVYGPDGTRYELSQTRTCNATNCGPQQYALTVVDPDDPDNWRTIDLPNSPAGNVVVDSDGVAYLTMYQDDGGPMTHVLVFRPDDPYNPSTIGIVGYPQGGVVVGTDGTVFQVSQEYDNQTGTGSTVISIIGVVPPNQPAV